MKVNKNFLMLASTLILSVCAIAQTKTTVTGVIRDTKGEPVPGAAVMIDGQSSVGVISDIDGKYIITIPDSEKGRLTFSCISFKTQTVAVAKRAVINVTLEEDSELLDEVVVVGYGAMRRSDLTGSVSSVKINENEAGRSTSMDQLLQGHAAGVQVTNNSASPDGGVTIRVRGTSSFNGDAQPLFVIDGVIMNSPSSSETLFSANSSTTKGISDEEQNGLMGINPQDIASIEILKDASATAIYGSLGANGVVLITTKSATKDRPTINFSVGYDVAQRYKTMEQMSLDQYVEYLEARGGATTRLKRIYPNYVDPQNRGELAVESMNWQDEVMRTAVSQRYYFSITGRPKTLSYAFSLGYNDKQGIIRSTKVDQYTIRLNIDKSFGKNFKIGAKINMAYIASNMTQGTTVSEIGSAASLCRSMLQYVPFRKLTDEGDDDDDSELEDDYMGGYGTPLKWLTDFASKRREARVIPSIYAQWKILPWLTFKSSFGGDYRNNDRIKFKSSRLNSGATGSVCALANYEQYTYNFDNTFMFNKKFMGGHALSGTVGMSARKSGNHSQSLEGWNIAQWKALENAMNASPYASFVYGESEMSTLSYFARAIYNFRDRYVLTATGRFDGSSKFKGANKFSFFPSYAFAWRLNQEPWFKVPVISMAKIRLGWGQVGNQAVSNYQTLTNYNTSSTPSHMGDISQGLNIALYPSNLSNPDLKWETTEQWNAGIDYAMWKGRLSFSADAYYKLTYDLLQSKNISSSSGFTTTWVNQGAISNRGLEFSISAVPVKVDDFEWSLEGNISLNRNRIESIDPDIVPIPVWIDGEQKNVRCFFGNSIGSGSLVNYPGNIYIEGYPMGLFYGLSTDGIVQEGEYGAAITGTTPTEPGSVNYRDLNGDNIITITTGGGAEDDRTIIGNPNPDFTYGFSTGVSYKNLSLDVVFNGSYGNDVLNINRVSDDGLSQVSVNHSMRAYRNAWTPENTNTTYPSLKMADNVDRMYIQDRFVEDASYLRLASVSLSYAFPIKKTSKVLKGLTFSLAANNLYVWTKYLGWDPDVNSYGSNLKKMGLDVNSYPGARTYSFDIKFRF